MGAQPRVAVLGAAGFIGANLVARLKGQGCWVRALDVHQTRQRAHLYGQADEAFLCDDLRMDGTARYAVQDVDRVYHLAADHGGAGYFYSNADFKAANNNLTIDRNVLKACMDEGVDRLFFASSACTYPVDMQGEGARPMRESDLGQGEGEQLYGMAKRMSTLLMEGARQHGMDARSGVFHTIYGPGQDYLEPRAKFPTAICRKILENPLRVEVWGDGTQVRTFLYIEDALDRIQAVMEKPYEGPVNIGSDEEVTVQQCCDWAAEAAGVKPQWVYTDGPVGVAHRAADNSEWNRRYGQGHLTPAKAGFRRLYEWLAAELHVEAAA